MKHGVLCRSALLAFSFACILPNIASLSHNPKVLLISFDGFRYDLLNETMVPNIHRWAKQSTWFVNGSRSQYITYTAPNHMGIVTGLYEESHGIVSNFFYDTSKNKTWDYFNGTHTPGIVNESLGEEWFNGEPIWITNERGGGSRLSASYYWPMGEAPFPTRPRRPHFHKQWTSYGNLTSWMADADDIIADFLRETNPVNFVAWYIAEPDHTLHTNGFFNGVLKNTLKNLDQLFEYVLGKMADSQLEDKINIILTADHGHAEINGAKNIMCIKDFLPEGNFTIGDHMIYPNDEKHAHDIFRTLKNAIKMHKFDVDVHLKENFPGRYHYTDSTRVGRIILEPKVGSAISFSCTAKQLERDYGRNSSVKFNSSTHGMDPDRPEMRAMLVMRGPDIVEKQMVGSALFQQGASGYGYPREHRSVPSHLPFSGRNAGCQQRQSQRGDGGLETSRNNQRQKYHAEPPHGLPGFLDILRSSLPRGRPLFRLRLPSHNPEGRPFLGRQTQWLSPPQRGRRGWPCTPW